jgi:hypothetical protein
MSGQPKLMHWEFCFKVRKLLAGNNKRLGTGITLESRE